MSRLPQWTPLLLGLLPLTALAASAEWRDVESRIQYAWYTEDARDLTVSAHRLAELAVGEPRRSYYLTLVHLHEAQVAARAGAQGQSTMAQAAAECVSSADEALAVRPTDAEVLALQSLCMDLRSRTHASLFAPRSQAQMEHALKLSPKDPRVQLLAAQLAYDTARTTQERAQLLGAFQRAVDAFELEREGLEGLPSWGGAEAWEGLALVYLDRGDAIAARSALEHALLLMPDYHSAHRLLDHILTG